MARQTTEQKIQELQAKQKLELARAKVRAQYDAIKPLLRRSGYFEASTAVHHLGLLIAAAQDIETKAQSDAGRVTP